MGIIVNGKKITQDAIDFELSRLVKFYSEHMAPAEVRKQMAYLEMKAEEQAIGARLLVDEAARLNLQVPAPDIDVRLEKMVKNSGGREKFDALLAKQKMTEADVRRSIEQGRKVDLLVEKVTGDAREPTEEEMQKHYEEHALEYMKPEQAQIQHVLLKPNSESKEDRSTARSRLLAIRDKIEGGADFAGQAAAHSECPSGRRTGGSLGWVSKGTMVPEFENAVFSLEIGALSDVVETRLGMHILRKTAQEESRPAPFEEVRDKIRDFLRHARRGELLSAFVGELKGKAVIEED
jgi:parvulin-like peptidyl-prolyl isomerase